MIFSATRSGASELMQYTALWLQRGLMHGWHDHICRYIGSTFQLDGMTFAGSEGPNNETAGTPKRCAKNMPPLSMVIATRARAIAMIAFSSDPVMKSISRSPGNTA
jgi:hypothetical protein